MARTFSHANIDGIRCDPVVWPDTFCSKSSLTVLVPWCTYCARSGGSYFVDLQFVWFFSTNFNSGINIKYVHVLVLVWVSIRQNRLRDENMRNEYFARFDCNFNWLFMNFHQHELYPWVYGSNKMSGSGKQSCKTNIDWMFEKYIREMFLTIKGLTYSR